MKKIICFVLSIVAIISVLYFGQAQETQPNSEYLRIHIRANSNSDVDQAVKLKVRDEIVEYMIPLLSQCSTKQESINVIKDNLSGIEQKASEVLSQNGFFYGAKGFLRQEEFPTRSYGELTLESGFYDALILNLGSGSGDNWWCVVYPPLCFVNGGSSVNAFKSRIWEIINNFNQKK